MYDIVLIGTGVIGCAIAERLSHYEGHFLALDAQSDVSQGASKANSGIVHAGYDAKPESQKSYYNVKGALMMEGLCARLGVPFSRPGALVLSFKAEDKAKLEALCVQSEQNGVMGCRVIDREEILALEPALNPEVANALLVPQSGLVSPYELTCALANAACENGVEFVFNAPVSKLVYEDGAWLVHSARGIFQTRAVINCAGAQAQALHNSISSKPVQITPRRGQYYLLDHSLPLPVTRTIFQLPTPLGKGVLVSPTTHGNLLLGPTAEDIEDSLDHATTAAGLKEVLEKVRLSYPKVSLRKVITTFSGVRAHEHGDDFIIGAVQGAPPQAFEAIGIESPGLSAAPAIGLELGDRVAQSLSLPQNPAYREPEPLPKPFSLMTDEERLLACQEDPDHGRIVCRCEQVTEAEIRRAIRRPVGAKSLDGVKMRCRAGMGRCQGGFCSTRVMQILQEELGISPFEVTKQGGNSHIVFSDLRGRGLKG